MSLLFKIALLVSVIFQAYSYINYSDAFSNRDWKLHGASIILLIFCVAYFWSN